MFRVVEGNTQGLSDIEEFIDLINDPPVKLRDFFVSGSDIFVARAPGRLDVMGGIADYSGSLVLELPISEATFAAIQNNDDEQIKMVSFSTEGDRYLEFELDLTDLSKIDSYNDARKFFSRDRRYHWASYVAGVFFILRGELGIEFPNGSRILISSHVPIGKGVSSSAALEVATMNAVCCAYDIDLDARQIAMLCQRVENYIVGAPCGVMDQIASSCGVEHSLISLLCQPSEIQGTIAIPDEIDFWGVDSGVRHSVAGSDYSSVRVGASIGYRIIAQEAGLYSEQLNDGLVKIDDDRWLGYLANIPPDEYDRDFSSIIPETINGGLFLEQYGGVSDAFSRIDPSVNYNVKSPTEHAIYESSRVKKFARLLNPKLAEQGCESLGRMMFESHESYSKCGLTESRTDRIVDLVRKNRSLGLYGARITGGGSGGTVTILAGRNRRDGVENLLKQIECETGQRPYVFHGSSPGAARFGQIRLGHS